VTERELPRLDGLEGTGRKPSRVDARNRASAGTVPQEHGTTQGRRMGAKGTTLRGARKRRRT